MKIPATNNPKFFVGRQGELRRLERALSATISSGRPQFVLIQGDVGIGKTALVEEFLDDLSAQVSAPLIGQGKCALETERNGLVPFSQVLGGLAARGSKMQLIGKGWDFVKEVAPAWLNLLTGGVSGAVLTTIGATAKLVPNSKYAEDNVFVQFTNAIMQLVDQRPIVLFVDDLHWADESSLRLLFHLQRNLQHGPVLMLCTYRSQVVSGIGGNNQVFNEIRANLIRGGATEITLSHGIDVLDYASKRYPQNMFSQDFLERIKATTEGHPLFVDQLFDLWESTGVVCSSPSSEHQEPIWHVAYGADVEINIPPALSEVLDLRLQIMEESLRNSLIYAAVEGQEFAVQVVARLRHLDELVVFDDLEALEHKYHFIQEQKPQVLGNNDLDYYHFEQRFMREYVYRQLPAGKRRILHRQVGEYLESLCGDDNLSALASKLAWHFAEAHQPSKAARYALRAAEWEQKRFAWLEGEKWCEYGLQQLDLASSDAQEKELRLEVLEKSAYGAYWAATYGIAHQRYHDALTLAHELSESPERIARLWAHLADLLEFEGQYDEAVRAVENGLQCLAQSSVPFGETSIRLRWIQAIMSSRYGNEVAAIDMTRSLLSDAQSLPQNAAVIHLLARVHNSLAVALFELGYCHESLDEYSYALKLAKDNGDQMLCATFLLNSASAYMYLHDAGQSFACICDGRTRAQRVGDADSTVFAEAQEAEAELLFGQPRRAVDRMIRAIEQARHNGSLWNLAHMNSVLALAYVAVGEEDKALTAAEGALAQAVGQNYLFEVGIAHQTLGQIYAALKYWKDATQHLAQAIEIQQGAGHLANLALSQRNLAQVLLAQGCKEEAHVLLTESLATLRQLNLTAEASATERLLL